jgi:hypothetical protein
VVFQACVAVEVSVDPPLPVPDTIEPGVPVRPNNEAVPVPVVGAGAEVLDPVGKFHCVTTWAFAVWLNANASTATMPNRNCVTDHPVGNG